MSTATEQSLGLSGLKTLVIELDPTLPLAEQIQRGHYDLVNDYYTRESWPLTVVGKRSIFLYNPRVLGSSDEIICRMEQDGCKPALLEDALALGATFPDLQRRNPIVFLGTVLTTPDQVRQVPVLGNWCGGRDLSINMFDGGWNEDCRFAAILDC